MALKLIKGIYLIERIIRGKNDNEPRYYVGQAEDIFARWWQHCSENEQHIDKAIQKYGCTEFSFSILEKVSKKSELNVCETKWINHYKTEYNEGKMYNISQTKNKNPHGFPLKIKNEIKQLFIEDIGRSIYAIAERYGIDWKEVVKIRMPLLGENGLKYDNKVKNIIEIDSEKMPDNWRGNRMTKSLSKKILSLRSKDLDNKDIAIECNISTVDLKVFFEIYGDGQKYDFADELLQ